MDNAFRRHRTDPGLLMRVRCIAHATPGDAHTAKAWLSIGSDYVVLSLALMPGRAPHVRVLTDDPGFEGLFDIGLFTILDATVSRHWSFSVGEFGVMEVGPPSWTPQFWEDYYDDSSAVRHVGKVDDSAREAFWGAVALIYEENGLASPRASLPRWREDGPDTRSPVRLPPADHE